MITLKLSPYRSRAPIIGAIPIPIPLQLGAVAWYNFTGQSKIIEGATSVDVAGWTDSSIELNSTQLLTNPNFDTDVSGWATSGVAAVWNNGIAEVTSTVTGGYPRFNQEYIASGSGWYRVSFNTTVLDGSANFIILPNGGGTRPYEGALSVGESSIDFYYDSTQGDGTGFDVYFQLNNPTSGDRLFLDYVRLKEYIIAPYGLSQPSASAQPVFAQGYRSTGSQLLNNSDFDTDVSGWSNAAELTVVWNNGVAEITSDVTGGYPGFTQGFSTTESGWYNLNLKVTKVDNPFFKVFILPNGGGTRPISIDLAVGTYDEPFYYDSTVGDGTGFTVYFELTFPNIGEQLFLDYVRLYEAVQDNSKNHIEFDGSDYLEESAASLTFAGDMTFAFKFKQDVGASNFGNLLSTKASAAGTSGTHIEIQSKTAMTIRGSSSLNYTFTGLTDLESAVSNIIIRVTGTTIELYQDGISKGTGTIDAVVANTEPLRLGTVSGSGNFYDGDMYEVSCFQKALTDSEITQLTSYMLPPLSPIQLGAVAWYDFTNSSKLIEGATSVDVAGWKDSETSTTYDLSQSTASAQPAFTQPNGPVVFDGSDYLEGVPNKTGDLTYAIKYKLNSETTAEVLLGESTSDNNILALLPQANTIRIRPTDGANVDFSVGQEAATEYVLIITRSGNNYTCYLNGASLGTQVNTSDFRPDWLCGRQSLGALLNGDLYDVSYYDKSLTASEIYQLNSWMNK